MIGRRKLIRGQGCRKEFLEIEVGQERSSLGEKGGDWGHSGDEGSLLDLCSGVTPQGTWKIICADCTRVAPWKASTLSLSN